jgi:hypothetical protein
MCDIQIHVRNIEHARRSNIDGGDNINFDHAGRGGASVTCS